MREQESRIKVWDIFVRSFHWLLVSAFVIAFATEDDYLTLHSWAGYVIGVLILSRILWGLMGTKYARFSNFSTHPKIAFQYIKDTFRHRAARYIGHNPAGGLMIVAVLISLLITIITGIAVLAAEENTGPLASTFIAGSEFWEDIFEGLHEFFANFSLLLALIHITGVVVESIIHKENLIVAMFSGYKRGSKAPY